MTVAELIDKLKEFPQDKIIAVNYDIHEINIKLLDEYFDGDSSNPNCLILENEVVNLS